MKIRSTDEEPSPSVIDIAAIKAEVLKMETEAEAALIRAVAEVCIFPVKKMFLLDILNVTSHSTLFRAILVTVIS
jgi:hypothetical protein